MACTRAGCRSRPSENPRTCALPTGRLRRSAARSRAMSMRKPSSSRSEHRCRGQDSTGLPGSGKPWWRSAPATSATAAHTDTSSGSAAHGESGSRSSSVSPLASRIPKGQIPSPRRSDKPSMRARVPVVGSLPSRSSVWALGSGSLISSDHVRSARCLGASQRLVKFLEPTACQPSSHVSSIELLTEDAGLLAAAQRGHTPKGDHHHAG